MRQNPDKDTDTEETDKTIRCGSCGEGPFYRDRITSPDQKQVVQGYWFCGWCFEYTPPNEEQSAEERLVQRAIRKGVPKAYA